jgi:hypothetical protein
MATTTAHRGVGDRIDDVQEAVSTRFADFAYSWGKRIAAHLLHVTAFVVLVVNRDHTVLALAAWLERQAGTAVAGMPATLLHLWSESFAGLWNALGPRIGL